MYLVFNESLVDQKHVDPLNGEWEYVECEHGKWLITMVIAMPLKTKVVSENLSRGE